MSKITSVSPNLLLLAMVEGFTIRFEWMVDQTPKVWGALISRVDVGISEGSILRWATHTPEIQFCALRFVYEFFCNVSFDGPKSIFVLPSSTEISA